ncbi:MAG: hypothetical protein LH615_14330, partial [Ferruginibacter sp.]|nr:hypothetical protein [Ferruginibacter sp.]
AMQFTQNFTIKEAEWKYFEALAAKDSIVINTITIKEKEMIEQVLKASLARQLFRAEGFYETVNEKDSFIKKALEVIK